ncbi:unnamed protein product [Lactuca saligna]|uniref:Damage-control phosphatase ARMT1-like metal-binding domain-containing protein n=1 Tax=Lactuca saligna TaxID=75948 RepID=A0AA36EMV4_LACSI|nr:unnamed protein product [Lactuca saligna]
MILILNVVFYQLKDENGKLLGVDIQNLLIANSGNDLPVIDLASVSQELAYLASDADLVICEGMGRGIETIFMLNLSVIPSDWNGEASRGCPVPWWEAVRLCIQVQ